MAISPVPNTIVYLELSPAHIIIVNGLSATQRLAIADVITILLYY